MFEELRDLFNMGGTEKQKKEASIVTVDIFSGTVEPEGGASWPHKASSVKFSRESEFSESQNVPFEEEGLPFYGGDSTSKLSMGKGVCHKNIGYVTEI